MKSKAAILSAIRQHSVADVPLPDLDNVGVEYDDPKAQFAEVLEAVGGRAVFVADNAELEREIRALDVYRQASKVFSRVEQAGPGNLDLDSVEDPHALNDLDLAIMPGDLAVAENAAVWVTDQAIRHRVVYFIAEYLILVVPAENLVHNMHQAYRQLKFDQRQYGLFISGPSKTADIEQSLVIGAQGPRSLHVFLVGAK